MHTQPAEPLTPEPQPLARLSPESLCALSDAEIQERIAFCAAEFIAAHRRYEQSGCFADAGSRDAWYHAECDALIERGKRPGVVARMESERGLA